MSITLEALGRIVREMQAEIRTIRTDHIVVQHAIINLGTAINDRIAQFELTFETRLDQFERNTDERLARIEQLLRNSHD